MKYLLVFLVAVLLVVNAGAEGVLRTLLELCGRTSENVATVVEQAAQDTAAATSAIAKKLL